MTVRIDGFAPLLQVFDMPRSLAFYRDVMGFDVAQRSAPGDDCDWCLLRRNGAELMLNAAYEQDARPAAPDPARAAAHEDTGLFFGCPDLDAAWRHLRENGIDASAPRVAPYGMRQVWCRDPDGYVLCLQWPAGE